MKKIISFIIALFAFAPFVSFGQSSGCNLSVTIDSIVVNPCFKVVGGMNAVNGGSCGCSNTLWAVVAGGTAPYTYTWSTNGVAQGNQDTLQNGCYVLWTVQVKDANGCITSASLNVVIPPVPTDTSSSIDTSAAATGINKYSNASSLKLYPVPATNQLNISLAQAANHTYVEVYDMLGKKVLTQTINEGATLATLDVSVFPAGNYFLRMIGNNSQKTAKFSVDK